jgi:hypothetical protein
MIRPTLASWVVRERRLIAILGPFVLISAVGLAWMFVSQRDPARYVATLDSLSLPPTWDVLRTNARRGDILYPSRATRYYVVEADPEHSVSILKDAMQAAGFEIYIQDASADWCDPHPFDSVVVSCPTKVIDNCHENGPGGPTSCIVQAFRRIPTDPKRLEHVYASLSPRGSTIDYGPGASPRYVQDQSRALVMIIADLSDPRFFWSSPTPPPTGDLPEP